MPAMRSGVGVVPMLIRMRFRLISVIRGDGLVIFCSRAANQGNRQHGEQHAEHL